MEEKTTLADIDKAMAVKTASGDGIDWYSADAPGLELNGFYWRKPGEPFRRLPLDAYISQGVNYLSWHTSGGMLRFRTDSPEIQVHAVLSRNDRMDHMAMTGTMGFDLYHGSGTQKFFKGTTRFQYDQNEYTFAVLNQGKTGEMREYTLHFPLYSGVEKFELGLTGGSILEKPTPWKDPRPIVVYGTSIQQGGCATRPGMSHTNQMSRMLNRPFINLAFSGSGKGEPEIAKILADIKDPAMYILDYDANAEVEGLNATLRTFIEILREKHPETPILQVSRLLYAEEFLNPNEYSEKRIYAKNRLIEEMYRGKVYGIPKCGTVGDVEAITGESLYEAWEHLLKTAFIRVFHLFFGASSRASILPS